MAALSNIQLFLVLFMVYTSLSGALQCYKSDKTNETCISGAQFCQTQETKQPPSGVGFTIVTNVRGCAQSCSAGESEDATGGIVKTSCCTDDLCNAPNSNDKLCYTCVNYFDGCGESGVNVSSPYVTLNSCPGPCMFSKVTISGDTTVVRACTSSCKDTEGSSGDISTSITCCTGDKCNANHASSLSIISGLMMLVVAANALFIAV